MKNPCFIAHRGFSGKYLQNTEEAFIKAVEHGSGGIETDVRITKDGVLVVNHNETAVFADGSELAVCDATFEELTAKPLLNEFTDTELYVCTFRRYLEICRDGNTDGDHTSGTVFFAETYGGNSTWIQSGFVGA